MNVEDAIRHRRSVRRFADRPVSSVVIRELLTLSSQAPNVANRQMWRFIVLADPDLHRMLDGLVQRRIDEMATWPQLEGQGTRVKAWREQAAPFAQAPVVILYVSRGYRTALDSALVERGVRFWEVANLFSYPDVQSISAAMAFLVLAAEERELATCWLTAPLLAKKDLQLALELKPGEEIVGMVALGYAAESPPPRPRAAIDELIEWR